MKKPRLFFIFILILLIINTAFFVLWYVLDMQDVIRKMIISTVSSALDAKLDIERLSVSNKQILAHNIRFQLDDKSLELKVEQLRIRYSLTKLIFPPYNLNKVIDNIEINNPYVHYHYIPKPPKESKKAFKIPDINPFFKELNIRSGSFSFQGKFPLGFAGVDSLKVGEHIDNLDLRIINHRTANENWKAGSSEVTMTSNIGDEGRIVVKGTLFKGALKASQAELVSYTPSQIEHPLLQELSADVSATLSVSQESAQSPFEYNLKSIVWDARLIHPEHRIRASYLSLEADNTTANLLVSTLEYNNNVVDTRFAINGLKDIRRARLDGEINLGSIRPNTFLPEISGSIQGRISISGTVDDPIAQAQLSSEYLSYAMPQDSTVQILQNIVLDAEYGNEAVTFSIPQARWNNQTLDTHGQFDLKTRTLSGMFNTAPIEQYGHDFLVEGTIEYDVMFVSPYPDVLVHLNDLNVYHKLLDSGLVSGVLRFSPLQSGGTKHYLADVNLISDTGLYVNAIGDIIQRTLSGSVEFSDLTLANLYAHDQILEYNPRLNGRADLIFHDNTIIATTSLNIDSDTIFKLNLNSTMSYDLHERQGFASISAPGNLINGKSLDFNAFAYLDKDNLELKRFQINDKLSVCGKVNTKDFKDFSFDAQLTNLNTDYIASFFGEKDIGIPRFENLDLRVKYNLQGLKDVWAYTQLKDFQVPSVEPLSLVLEAEGVATAIDLHARIDTPKRARQEFRGMVSLSPAVNLELSTSFDQVLLSNFVILDSIDAKVSGSVQVKFDDIMSKSRNLNLFTDIVVRDIVTPAITIDSVVVILAQRDKTLDAQNVEVHIKNLLTLKAEGKLDYNLLTSTFFEGDNELKIEVDARIFDYLEDRVPVFEKARGISKLSLVVKSFEEEFLISSGSLNISDGVLQLANQIEPITDFHIIGDFENNRLLLRDASFHVGNGKVTIYNQFDDEPSDHFFIGFLDLGRFLLRTTDSGIKINIPGFTLPKTTTTIALKGRNSRYASISGPFDDMKILGDLTISDASVVFPPNTENLLKMINSVRDVGKPKKKSDPQPLPFNLDLMVDLQENLRYVTFPVNIEIMSNSYIHVVYDGNKWIVNDALFASEKGNIDFFGTIFQVDFLSFRIVDAQDLMSVDGDFISRTADGTVVTLNVRTDSDLSKDFLNRISFNLVSDNPDDVSATQILSRLRYNRSMEDLTPEEKQSLLQDEALGIVSQSLNSTLLAPVFYPIQNRIRRFLRLDAFTIQAGFIQNLFTEYQTDSQQLSEIVDMKQLNSDIVQFSSSILLNNLSIGMSKYLGRKIYLDYNFKLQEATDIYSKTQILVRHDTGIRVVLPERLRLSYTFTYEPVEEDVIHEIMLQRSFRF